MQMKKLLTAILAIALLLGGLFLWKGGHHAVALAELLEEYLDSDDSAQTLTVQILKPDITVDDSGQVKPEVRQMTVSADSFWTEYGDRTLFGLTVQGMTAFTDGKMLYMDTGRAYALPDLQGLKDTLRRVTLGLLLHGKVTKSGDTYRLDMKTGELELSVDINADRALRTAYIIAVLPDDTAVHISVTVLPASPHTIPQPVANSMVRAQMEPPMSLSEPLDILAPALEELLPLSGELTLGVESGILRLSETVGLTVRDSSAVLDRDGVLAELSLPAQLRDLPAAAVVLFLLRDGEFTRSGTDAELALSLPGDGVSALLEALIPQAKELDISMDSSSLSLLIRDGQVCRAVLTADGSVPFLFTAIPVAFSAELTVS